MHHVNYQTHIRYLITAWKQLWSSIVVYVFHEFAIKIDDRLGMYVGRYMKDASGKEASKDEIK